MVRAILEGRKTQTRRAVKPQPDRMFLSTLEPYWNIGGFRLHKDATNRLTCPYGPVGRRLWVRETWRSADRWLHDCESDPPRAIAYRADLSARNFDPPYQAKTDDWGWENMKWRSPIHMPRWASRITLEVTDVRVERLQEISDADAIAEGCVPRLSGTWWQGYMEFNGDLMHQTTPGEAPPEWMIEPKRMAPTPHLDRSARDEYRVLWAAINSLESWDANPWVWRIEFRRVEAPHA